MCKSSSIQWFMAAALAAFASSAAAQPTPPNNTPDATLRSTPDTVVWGYFAAEIAPALRIKSGQTVRIDTVSHGGVNIPDDPVTYFGKAGIPADQVLKDAVEISGVTLSADKKTVRISLPEVKPVMQMNIKYNIKAADGTTIHSEIFNTINKVPGSAG